MKQRIYLAYTATQPLLPSARAASIAALDLVGNPSSVHADGRRARAVVEDARRSVAALVGASAENVVFTGSATEAAVTCLSPRWLRDGSELLISDLAVIDADHPSTREGGQFAANAVTRLPVDANGLLDFDALDRWLGNLAGRPAILAICLANGETGVIQPLDAVRAAIADHDVILVVDAVQSAGRMPLSIETLAAEALILSAHKIGAAKGVGAMVLRTADFRPFRLITGGGQEKGMRSGTEAVSLIASFGAAAEEAVSHPEDSAYLAALRERLVAGLRDQRCEFTALGENAPRLANTLAVAAPGLRAETTQIALDLEGFAVSAGSACSSGKVGQNHVLSAMANGGLAVDPALGLIRVSMGRATTEAEVDTFTDVFARIIRRANANNRSREAA